MIIVLGSVAVREDRVPEALALSHEHVARSRAEPGCIAHAVYQDPADARRLVFVEQWADKPALAAHFRVPASGAFVRALGALAAQAPSMSVYEASEVSV